MWPYPWTHVGTPSHLGHMDRAAATMPSQAHAEAAQKAPDIGQWEGQDVPLVRPSSCYVKEGIPSYRRYLPTYLTLYRLLALLQGSFAETRDKQCACCIRGEHKPVIYTCFIEVILGIRILWSWILSVSKGGIPMFTYLCVSRHFRHYT